MAADERSIVGKVALALEAAQTRSRSYIVFEGSRSSSCKCDLPKIEHLAVGNIVQGDLVVTAPTSWSVAALVALNDRRIVDLASGEEAKLVDRYRTLTGHYGAVEASSKATRRPLLTTIFFGGD